MGVTAAKPKATRVGVVHALERGQRAYRIGAAVAATAFVLKACAELVRLMRRLARPRAAGTRLRAAANIVENLAFGSDFSALFLETSASYTTALRHQADCQICRRVAAKQDAHSATQPGLLNAESTAKMSTAFARRTFHQSGSSRLKSSRNALERTDVPRRAKLTSSGCAGANRRRPDVLNAA
eukprot:scaffold1875_cov253-Pinguiococcus_pyrenoidosus.AAC.24